MRFLIAFLLLALSLPVSAQVDVCGTVIDREASEPLAGASVMVKGADGKIRKFATTKAGPNTTPQNTPRSRITSKIRIFAA